jgi:hypothetical protein
MAVLGDKYEASEFRRRVRVARLIRTIAARTGMADMSFLMFVALKTAVVPTLDSPEYSSGC